MFHYRQGAPAQWRENVPAWNALVCRGLYEGIDLRVTGREAGIKYEFVVAPGVDWRQVQVRFEGIGRLARREDGALVVHLAAGWPDLVDAAPAIYQDVGGRQVRVTGEFLLVDETTYGFVITGEWDHTRPLIIDPELVWSAYLGGIGNEEGNGIALDRAGNVWVVGYTGSTNWVSGGANTNYSGGLDGFAARVRQVGRSSAIVVTGLVLETGTARLAFSVSDVTPTAITVESTPALDATMPWALESGAVISSTAPGQFDARIPVQGSQRFYRIRATP